MRKQLPISGQERKKWLEWVTILQRYTYGHDSVREGWKNMKIVDANE